MKAKKNLILTITFLVVQIANAQNDLELITKTLNDYIDGTANGKPDKLKKAFHPNFNLYTITSDSLWIRSGKEYISNVKKGKKYNRIGRIISIDYEKDTAIVKAEIIVPNWRIFIDYFLLLKYKGEWKIIHKSYTWREYQNSEK